MKQGKDKDIRLWEGEKEEADRLEGKEERCRWRWGRRSNGSTCCSRTGVFVGVVPSLLPSFLPLIHSLYCGLCEKAGVIQFPSVYTTGSCVCCTYFFVYISIFFFVCDLPMKFLEGQRNTEWKCGQEVVRSRKKNMNLPFTAAWWWCGRERN